MSSKMCTTLYSYIYIIKLQKKLFTWLTATIRSTTPIARFLTDITAKAINRVEITPRVNITGKNMKERRFKALWPNVRPTFTSERKN